MSLLSIIVPVYNAKKSIHRCVDSLIQQTYKELEIILVDDGSTDGSEQICEEYAKKDQRIVVIHKKNAGVSAARNTGIRRASGVYVQFVDSDDYLDLDGCEILVKAMEESDGQMVICGYWEHKDEEKKKVCYQDRVFHPMENISEEFGAIYRSNLLNVPWNKLFYRNWIALFFDEEISLGEDLLFNMNYLKHVDCLVIINAAPYHYMIGNETLSRMFRPDYADITIRLQKEVSLFAKEYLNSQGVQKQIDGATAVSFYRGMGHIVKDSSLTVKEKKGYLKQWLRDKRIITIVKNADAEGIKEKIMKCLIKLKWKNLLYLLLCIKAKKN